MVKRQRHLLDGVKGQDRYWLTLYFLLALSPPTAEATTGLQANPSDPEGPFSLLSRWRQIRSFLLSQ